MATPLPRKTPARPSAPNPEDAQQETALTERASANGRTRRLRLRAAWMYFIEEMTQNDIARQLGVGRVTVVRLLSDARARHEIKFSLERSVPECIGLERELEQRFGLKEAVVVPLSSAQSDATESVSAATGEFLSNFVKPGMKIGVGWGRTLLESLRHIHETSVADLSVVSLLGGFTKVKRFNPAEFAWRFSSLFQAECYLMTAPAIVDTPETRRTLIERCGLNEVFERAKSLDAVLFSVGNLAATGTAYRDGFLSDTLRQSMIDGGAVGESLFHFYDASGKLIRHPIHDCVMAVPPEIIRKAPQRIMASGGIDKAVAIYAALRLFEPTVLITDELAATRILEIERGD